MPDPLGAFGVLGTIYRPVIVASIECPRTIQQPNPGYLDLGAPRHTSIQFFDGDSVGLLSEHSGDTYTWLSHGNRWKPANR